MGPLASVFKSWLPWAVIGAAAGAMYMGQPLFALIIVGAGVVGALAATIGRTKKAYELDPTEGLTLDAQARLRPLIRAQQQLAEITERNGSHPAIKVVGAEALQEADGIISRASDLLKARSELLRAGPSNDEERIEGLKAKIELSTDLLERERLEAALALAEGAQDHRERRQEALSQIDAQLEEAREALEATRAELAATLTEQGGTEDDLREHLSQLQSLGDSLEEAKTLLRDSS